MFSLALRDRGRRGLHCTAALARQLHRQTDGKGGPLSLPALHGDGTAHGVQQDLYDGEAQSRPHGPAAGGGLLPLERLENPPQKLLRHSHARVRHPELIAGVPGFGDGTRVGCHGDGAADGGELDAVADEVRHNSAEAVGVHQHLRLRNVQFGGQGHTLGLRLGAHHVHGLLQFFPQGADLGVQMHLPGVDLAHFQQVVNERHHVGVGLPHPVQIGDDQVPLVYMLPRQICKAHNGVHRCADVVGNVKQESGLGLMGLLLLFQFQLHAQTAGGVLLHPAGLLRHVPEAHDGVVPLVSGAAAPYHGELHIAVLPVRGEHPVVQGHRPALFQPPADVFPGHGVQKRFPVQLHHALLRVDGNFGQQEIVHPVGAHGAAFQIDETDGAEIHAQALNDLRPPSALVLGHVLLRHVQEEHVEHAAKARKAGEVAEVVHPADSAVLADDTVFHGLLPVVRLPGPAFFQKPMDRRIILRVDHAPEGKACQLPELVQGAAAVHPQDSGIGVHQALVLVILINQEAAGHLFRHPLNHGQGLIRREGTLRRVLRVCPGFRVCDSVSGIHPGVHICALTPIQLCPLSHCAAPLSAGFTLCFHFNHFTPPCQTETRFPPITSVLQAVPAKLQAVPYYCAIIAQVLAFPSVSGRFAGCPASSARPRAWQYGRPFQPPTPPECPRRRHWQSWQ